MTEGTVNVDSLAAEYVQKLTQNKLVLLSEVFEDLR